MRWILLIGLCLNLISCLPAKKQPVTPQEEISEPAVEETVSNDEEVVKAWENAIETSLRHFDTGMAMLEHDHLAAMEHFDLAVLEILDCQTGFDGEQNLQDHLEDLITWIHDAEREAAIDGAALDPTYEEGALTRLLEDMPLDLDANDTNALPNEDFTDYDMPVVSNRTVEQFIESFTNRKADLIGGHLERSTRYLPMIRRIFTEEGLPMDLAYLPLIESGYKRSARSRKRAVGLWQFVAYVGRHYGLTIDWYEDQRRDPEAATRAAARFFKDLYADMDDWNLTLCAYNYGPGRVKRATRRAKSRDFWVISRKRLIPRETRGYVPAFMAAVRIARNPERYGFGGLNYQQPVTFDTVDVDFSISLKDLAKKIDLKVEDLYDANPALIRGVTPGGRSYRLKVPLGYGEKAKDALDSIPEQERKRLHRHRLARGETLSGLAKRYDTTVRALMTANNIRDPRRLRAGKVLMIPLGRNAVDGPISLSEDDGTTDRMSQKTISYKVRRGDTLYHLAKRFQTSIPSLIAANPKLDPLAMRPGQTLKIAQGDRWSKTKKAPSRSRGFTRYRVRRGDTVSGIAKRFGVKTSHLLKTNGLNSRSIIKPGQSLKVPNTNSSKERVITYTVKRGDTLYKIAKRFRTNVARLREWNRLGSGNHISIGQKLVIYQ